MAGAPPNNSRSAAHQCHTGTAMMDRLQSGARPAMTRANGNRPPDDGVAPRSVSRPHRPLYRTGYPFRILGMGLSSLTVGVVLVQHMEGEFGMMCGRVRVCNCVKI